MDVLLSVIGITISVVVSIWEWLNMFLAKPLTLFTALLFTVVMLQISYAIHAVHDKTLKAMQREADLNAAEQMRLLQACGSMLVSIQSDLKYRLDDGTKIHRHDDHG